MMNYDDWKTSRDDETECNCYVCFAYEFPEEAEQDRRKTKRERTIERRDARRRKNRERGSE